MLEVMNSFPAFENYSSFQKTHYYNPHHRHLQHRHQYHRPNRYSKYAQSQHSITVPNLDIDTSPSCSSQRCHHFCHCHGRLQIPDGNLSLELTNYEPSDDQVALNDLKPESQNYDNQCHKQQRLINGSNVGFQSKSKSVVGNHNYFQHRVQSTDSNVKHESQNYNDLKNKLIIGLGEDYQHQIMDHHGKHKIQNANHNSLAQQKGNFQSCEHHNMKGDCNCKHRPSCEHHKDSECPHQIFQQKESQVFQQRSPPDKESITTVSCYNDSKSFQTMKDYIKDRKLHVDHSHYAKHFQRISYVQIPRTILTYFILFISSLKKLILYKPIKVRLFYLSAISFTLFSLMNTSQASSLSPSKLHVNVIIAQSCDETFLNSLKSKVSSAIENFTRNEIKSNPGDFEVTFSVFPECNSANVLAHLSEIFSNGSTNTVVALASYDIHASFIPLAEVYQKAYIVCNNHVTNPLLTSPTFAPFPSFAQEAKMLAKILDLYRWQNVYVIHTDFRYWLDFSTTLYYTLTSQQFYVTLAKVDLSQSDEATRILQNVGNRKVIVLLMDLSDQENILAAASALSLTTKHAIFAFTDSPYDVKSRSLVGLTKETASLTKFTNDVKKPDVSIFESVFVIGSSFPKSDQNSSGEAQSENENVQRRKRHAETPLTFRSERAENSQNNGEFLNIYPLPNTIDAASEYKNSNNQISNINKGLYKNKPEVEKTNKKFENVSKKNRMYRDQEKNVKDRKGIEESQQNNNFLQFQSENKHLIKNDNDIIIVNSNKDKKRNYDYNDDINKSNHTHKVNNDDVNNNNNNSNNDNHNSQPIPGQGDYSIIKTNNYHLTTGRTADQKSLLGNGGEEIIEYRTKRDVHDFKTVESDLDAVYDIVYLLAFAAYENYRSGVNRALDSRYLLSKLANISFTGATGRFDVGPNLQVNFDFAVFDFNSSSRGFEPRILLEASSPSDWTLVDNVRISWPGRIVLPGDDCFKQISGCGDDGFETAYIITIIIATIAIVFIVVFVITLLRRYLTNKEMAKGPNKILMTSADLVFIYKKDVGKSSRTMLKSRGTLTEKENTPDIIRASDPASRSMPSLNDLNDFTQTARYNGDLVHVKELDIEGFEMKSKLLTYIRMLRDLRHENLNPYVGFMVERENKPALVMEYCSRGSLHDMIHNEDIKLDWDFKLSLLTDLVRGMRYLHSSPLKFHGHLTSHTCVIDSRFVLKITTYGVSGIMERCKAQRTMEARDCLWSAPELLRDPVLLHKGTDKGDIYSLAIIFQEVTLRSEPYSTTGLTPEEVVRKLKKPPPLIRPSVTPQAAPPQFIQIMKQCWAEMPEMRPSLDEIYDQFKKLTGGKKANIVDTMFKMLEKYSNDLEDIVADRTMQLEEEKKKTDQLLFRMLPSTVAESLKLGQTVEAETFSEVSIYFSDIVGFTTISAMSTPMQVVDLLNDLYTMFDATIDNYDVYKVETIGDAYMVASGLPIRNGNRHAGEISTMALMLLSQCGEFTIRHMPHVPLRLRIGLHTGSCVAGVVGLTMPRFCLFGDTVNTASRMESTGAAFRIHISEACKNVLDVLGGYKVAFRGKTELKGKGKLNTYWLVGKEGLDKELPEPPPLVGGDNHGLESLLRHMESDPASTTQKPVGTVSPTKSTSAPDLATPGTSPQPPSNNNNSNNTLLPVPDGSNLLSSSSVSQPAKLDNLETLHKESCKLSDQNQLAVVKVDVHGCGKGRGQNDFVGGVNDISNDKSPGTDEGLEVEDTMDTSLVGMETGKGEYNNHHSESNDSGFGSERKHSQGQDFNAAFQPGCSSSAISEKVKRNSSMSSMASSSNRTSVISSSDVTLNHHLTLNSECHEETLAPVSEV